MRLRYSLKRAINTGQVNPGKQEKTMSIENYERLLRRIAKQACTDEQTLVEKQEMEFKGTTLRFDYLERLNICRLSLMLDPPPGDPVGAMRGMLEANGQLGDEVLTVMALDPASGRPLMQFHLPLGDHLEEAVCHFATLGMEGFLFQWNALWREQRQDDVEHADMLA
jgi:hypothetical protein